MANASNVTVVGQDAAAKPMNITLLTIGSATIVMNIFVLSIFVMHKWMRSNSNIIICSMAVTDLMAGMVTITAGVVKWTDWFTVNAGIFCEVFYTIDGWAAFASLAHVLVVNMERYLAIVFPLKYKHIVSANRIKCVLLFVWIVTLIEAVLYTVSFKLGNHCLWEAIPRPALAFAIQITAVASPFIAVIAIYVHIVIVVVQKLRFMAKSSNLDQAALAQSQRKMFVVVSAILAAWIVCWLPLMCVLLVLAGAEAFHMSFDDSQFATMYYYVEVMSYGNSLLNPILYFLTSRDFRKAGLQLFKCTSNDVSSSTVSTTESTRM